MKIKFIVALFVVFPLLVPAQSFDYELEALAQELAEKLYEKDDFKVAVWGFFSSEKEQKEFDTYLTEDFAIYLADHAKHFQVIDRTQLNAMLKEHRLTADGFIDERATKRLGKIIAADAVVVGSYTVLRTEVKIRVKVLDTETALQIEGVLKNLQMDSAIARILGKL